MAHYIVLVFFGLYFSFNNINRIKNICRPFFKRYTIGTGFNLSMELFIAF